MNIPKEYVRQRLILVCRNAPQNKKVNRSENKVHSCSLMAGPLKVRIEKGGQLFSHARCIPNNLMNVPVGIIPENEIYNG